MAGPSGCGFSEEGVWNWTPRQMAAVAEIAKKLDRRRRAADLSLASMAARGDGDDLKKLHRELSSDI